jgi:hypothetical protein
VVNIPIVLDTSRLLKENELHSFRRQRQNDAMDQKPVKLNRAGVFRFTSRGRRPPANQVVAAAREPLPGSTLPDELRQFGYDVTEIGEGQRISSAPIVEKLALTSSGAFELLTPESTKLVAQIRTHAGIARVMRYRFSFTMT